MARGAQVMAGEPIEASDSALCRWGFVDVMGDEGGCAATRSDSVSADETATLASCSADSTTSVHSFGQTASPRLPSVEHEVPWSLLVFFFGENQPLVNAVKGLMSSFVLLLPFDC
mmetsp:Transcript_9389/g.20542  ORF Transcript_9389/g.20542 Transcript_9389/m.20542 type:complete len:115 (+) Transcript_9389:293-637(+)